MITKTDSGTRMMSGGFRDFLAGLAAEPKERQATSTGGAKPQLVALMPQAANRSVVARIPPPVGAKVVARMPPPLDDQDLRVDPEPLPAFLPEVVSAAGESREKVGLPGAARMPDLTAKMPDGVADEGREFVPYLD